MTNQIRKLSARIEVLQHANKRLRVAPTKLGKENERLRARVAELESNRSWVDRPRYERLRAGEADWKLALETCHTENTSREARIEAALAKVDEFHRRPAAAADVDIHVTSRDLGRLVDAMVKALKGEEDE